MYSIQITQTGYKAGTNRSLFAVYNSHSTSSKKKIHYIFLKGIPYHYTDIYTTALFQYTDSVYRTLVQHVCMYVCMYCICARVYLRYRNILCILHCSQWLSTERKHFSLCTKRIWHLVRNFYSWGRVQAERIQMKVCYFFPPSIAYIISEE